MSDAIYMRAFMRTYRRKPGPCLDRAIAQLDALRTQRRRRLRQRHLRDWSGLFKPLASDDQREGYCVFCGHELGAVVNDVVCTRCRREIES